MAGRWLPGWRGWLLASTQPRDDVGGPAKCRRRCTVAGAPSLLKHPPLLLPCRPVAGPGAAVCADGRPGGGGDERARVCAESLRRRRLLRRRCTPAGMPAGLLGVHVALPGWSASCNVKIVHTAGGRRQHDHSRHRDAQRSPAALPQHLPLAPQKLPVPPLPRPPLDVARPPPRCPCCFMPVKSCCACGCMSQRARWRPA